MKPRAPVASYSWINGSVITLQDYNTGTLYHYDVDAKTITRGSDSFIVYLDDEQGAATHSYLMQVVQTDVVVNDVDTMCTPENPCGDPMSAEPTPMFGDTGPSSSEVTFSLSPAERMRRGGKVGTTVEFPNEVFKREKTKGGIRPLSEDFSCSEIASAMILDKITFRQDRTDPLIEMVGAAFFEGANYLAGKLLPPGVIGGAVWLTNHTSGILTSHVKYSVLGTLWNSKGCGSGPVMVSTWNPIGGAGPGPREYLRCVTYPGSITINGQTVNVSIEVCYFEEMK
jgi:hypothetical protein